MNGERRLRVGACLSLTGRFARFGTQAARGLDAWRVLDGAAELLIEDDAGDPRTLEVALRRLIPRCDVLLGPYSTLLARVAGRVVADAGLLLWNHGGSGDDVETRHPGHVISVLTPAGRYAEPFLRHLAEHRGGAGLRVVHGDGAFGRQAAAGALAGAHRLGIPTVRLGPGDGPRVAGRSTAVPAQPHAAAWDLFAAGTFEQDVATVTRSRGLPVPPRLVCAVAAGVREFADAVGGDADGVFGVAQWFPADGLRTPKLGPTEAEFVAAYGGTPDYPAAQAFAAAVLAAHTTRLAGGMDRATVWSAAAGLDTDTLFGRFRIDPVTGAQLGHETVLTRWTPSGPAPA